MSGFYCQKYEGEGQVLRNVKDSNQTSQIQLDSFVRVSTCQRLEIYSEEKPLQKENMQLLGTINSLLHLIELASGIQSGLFGETEIRDQLGQALKVALNEKHVSKMLEAVFMECLSFSDSLRKEFSLHANWLNAVSSKISGKKVYVIGDSKLAQLLREQPKANGYEIVDSLNFAETIIITRKTLGTLLDNYHSQHIINLTDAKVSDNEMSLNHFFTSPDESIIKQINARTKDFVQQIISNPKFSMLG